MSSSDPKRYDDLEMEATGYRSPRVFWVVSIAVAVALVTIWLGHRFDPPYDWPSRDEALRVAGRIVDAAHGAGVMGVVGVVAAFALGVLLAVPSSIMVFAVTLVYGLWAIPIVFAGAFLGLALAFEIARTTLREDFNLFWHRHIPGTRGITNALESRGLWLVICARICPIIPFSGQNYMFGTLLTPAREYLIGSAIGIVPIILARVYVFDKAAQLVDPMPDMVDLKLFALGLIATVAIIAMLYRPVRDELARARMQSAGNGG